MSPNPTVARVVTVKYSAVEPAQVLAVAARSWLRRGRSAGWPCHDDEQGGHESDGLDGPEHRIAGPDGSVASAGRRSRRTPQEPDDHCDGSESEVVAALAAAARSRRAAAPSTATVMRSEHRRRPAGDQAASRATATSQVSRSTQLLLRRRSTAASWPQAPSISRPRVSRTVTATPWSSSFATKARSASGDDAVQTDPGVGLSGITLTWTRRLLSIDPSRWARHGWSLMSRINAYSMEIRRPGDVGVCPGGVQHLLDGVSGVQRHESVAQLVVRCVQ